MPPRRRIPSFSLSNVASIHSLATAIPPIKDQPSISNPVCDNETGGCTPRGQAMSLPLTVDDLAGPHSSNFALNYGYNEDNVTPRSYTSHFPASSTTSFDSRIDRTQLLTSRTKPKTPGAHATKPTKISSPRVSTNIRDAGGKEEPSSLDNFEDWCVNIPKATISAVSLPPSARISTTSRSPSKIWVHDPEANSHYSADFPPSRLTDLVLIPRDRDVTFHVETSIVFRGSPALADLIRPYLSLAPRDNTAVPEVDIYMMEDTYEALDTILRFIYPHATKPAVRSITHLARLLAACKKYEVAAGIHILGVLLLQFAAMAASPTNTNTLVGSPIQCYGIACKFGLSNIAKLVSTHCLMVDPLKVNLGALLVGVAAKDMRRLFDLHHSRGLAALSLVDTAVDSDEFWCEGCSGVAAWFDIWRETAEHELKSKPISRTVFSPSFIAGCLKQATKRCPHHCMEHYLASKTQLRFAILQRDIDSLKSSI